jgi:hypothetical protein
MKTLATQRSLRSLRANGWTCHIVEKFLPARGTMKFPRRIDAFGIGDILACRPATYKDCRVCEGKGTLADTPVRCRSCDGTGKVLAGEAAIALVQCFPNTGGAFAKHREKILAIPALEIWKKAGGRVFLQSWALQGPRGEKKKWTMREEEL